jgi:hypothetical protein
MSNLIARRAPRRRPASATLNLSVVSAGIAADGDTVTITLNRAVTGHTGFTLAPSGAAATLTYSSGDATDTLVFAASREIEYDETVTLSGGGIQDAAGVVLASFTDFPMSNLSLIGSGEPDDGTPVPPVEFEVPAYSLPGGTVHTPDTAAELTTLLGGGDIGTGALATGDVIQLAANTTYQGSFVFPDLGGTTAADYVYVISSAIASLPAAGTRITDSDLTDMPILLSPAADGPAACMEFGSCYYRFAGIRFESGKTGNLNLYLVTVGRPGATSANPVWSDLADAPHDIVFDRCIIRGRDDGIVYDTVGMELNGNNIGVVDSIILGFRRTGASEARAISIWNGGSGYTIENNELSASHQAMMVGGNDPALDQGIPSDIVVRGNYFFKPLHWKEDDPSWDGLAGNIKNHFELKNAKRVLITANDFRYTWRDGQGSSIVFTPRNQSGGAAWCTVQDVNFYRNSIDHTHAFITITPGDNNFTCVDAARITIEQNRITNVGWDGSSTNPRHLVTSSSSTYVLDHLHIIHNTFVEGIDGDLATSNQWRHTYGGSPRQWLSNLVFKDNIFECELGTTFGVGYIGGSHGTVDIEVMAGETYTFGPNLMIHTPGTNDVTYPATCYLNELRANVGFADYVGGDYTLGSSGLNFDYRAGGARDASDNTDMGCDIDALETAIAGVGP